MKRFAVLAIMALTFATVQAETNDIEQKGDFVQEQQIQFNSIVTHNGFATDVFIVNHFSNSVEVMNLNFEKVSNIIDVESNYQSINLKIVGSTSGGLPG